MRDRGGGHTFARATIRLIRLGTYLRDIDHFNLSFGLYLASYPRKK